MPTSPPPGQGPFLADYVATIGEKAAESRVVLDNKLIPLLSEQLYGSPTKAIEELVVNSYDANAFECRVFVPPPSEMVSENGRHFIVVFDDGNGMTLEELIGFWQVGRSSKRGGRISSGRKQIGKFGIGKLATYAVALRLTYVTRTWAGPILTSTLNYRDLEGGSDDHPGEQKNVVVPIRKINDWSAFGAVPTFRSAWESAGLDKDSFMKRRWTFAILEDLKDRSKDLKSGRLRWVLSTAMPLKSDFKLVLNNEVVPSAKDGLAHAVRFDLADLHPQQIKSRNTKYKTEWKKSGRKLTSKTFPSGVTGEIVMTAKPLSGGKSDDLERSHGFFVRVRERVVNLEDIYFGSNDLSHKYFSRFRADVNVDDLDHAVKASREGLADSSHRNELVALMRAVFNHARQLFDDYESSLEKSGKTEDTRSYVSPRLVEHPIADVLASGNSLAQGAEADGSWFYLEPPKQELVPALARRLYADERKGYRFQYTRNGRTARMLGFDPETSTIILNESHEFVSKHQDGAAKACLEDIAIAEVMLEIYLRQEKLPSGLIGEILQRRDTLFRSLAKDSLQSPRAIAEFLRNASGDPAELEIAIVLAARAIGFVAQQISNADKPDGIARFREYPHGERWITLEAKSSRTAKQLSHDEIGFATLKEHMAETTGASGCMLVAPAYAGQIKNEESNAIAHQARQDQISCWTIEQLASVVERIETHYVSAKDVYDIVARAFAPVDVERAVQAMFEEAKEDNVPLLLGLVEAFRRLETRMSSQVRTVTMLATELTSMGGFHDVQVGSVKRALHRLAAASKGCLTVGSDEETLHLHTSIEELARRTGMTDDHGSRKPGLFKAPSKSP